MKYRHKPKTVIPPPWPDPDRVFENLGVILAADMVDLESGKLFYCPSAKEGAFTWDAYGGQGNWPVKRGRLRSGFCYIPQSLTLRGHVNGEKFPNTAVKMSDTNPSLSMLADNLQSVGNVIAHQIGNYIGANLLYGNGAVKFSKDPALTEWYKQNPSGNLMQSPDYRRVLKLME